MVCVQSYAECSLKSGLKSLSQDVWDSRSELASSIDDSFVSSVMSVTGSGIVHTIYLNTAHAPEDSFFAYAFSVIGKLVLVFNRDFPM